MRSHPSIYSSEDCTKKLSYFLSKGNWCLKENYPCTKEHTLEALNHAILFNLWNQYTAGSISTTRLLNQCGRVNGNNFFTWAASWLKRGASWQWGELTWILCIHLDTGFDFQI